MSLEQPDARQIDNTQGEFGRLTRLALPLMGAQLAQMGMGVVDTVMAGRLSAEDLAGIALGGSVMWPVNLLAMGFLQALTPSVAQLNGAGRHERIGEVIRQGLWLALASALVVVTVITHARPYYELMGVDPAAVEISVPYLQASACGIPGVLGYFVLRYMVEGLGYTRPAMFIAAGALVMKIPLNYVFMYGAFGVEGMGGVGCGVSTAIIMWLEFAAIMVVATRSRFDHVCWREKFSLPRWDVMGELLVVGLPIGVTLFLEVGFFTLVTVLTGRFGAETVASHTIAMNVGGITFMLPLALGIAASIRVGFNIGAGDPGRAMRTAGVAVGATVCIGVTAALIVLAGRHFIAGLYTNDPAVLELAATLMLFLTVFQLFDNCQATAIGALRGYKDTRVPMFINLFGYWFVGLPIATTLGFGWLGEALGIYGFWTGLVISLAVVAALLLARLWWISGQAARS